MMRTRPLSRVVVAGVALATAFTLGGCGPDLYDVPLPSKVKGETYSLSADFESALNLPPASPVKLEGRTVGQVTEVTTSDYVAHVSFEVMKDTKIPTGSRVEVRLTAPVGEAFVALIPPAEPTSGVLAAGTKIGLENTNTAPDTTDLLTGVSAAVTGGSYADLKVVVDELATAMDGSSTTVRHLLREVDNLVTSTNRHRDDIDASLDALDRLTAGLADDTELIASSIKKLDPAIRTLQGHEDKAVKLLVALDRIEASSRKNVEGMRGRLRNQLKDTRVLVDAVIAERDQLRPIMTGITAFADALDRATPGDFAMFDLTFNLIPALPAALGNVPIAPDATTLLEGDLAELLTGLQDTVTDIAGDEGLVGQLIGGLAGGGG
ncbi:phospholipid/cholesterol/gamma-HCH transport system substrate-binding protein [Aeromicrobium panaciterrae]|uniref:Phospholipid/cholesterol/gamma-HCH transport system substrate-binding protein n=2 Tax=Aeromicrobium panaciterrae TaxID=363861 RepID=A0ABU1URL6_9ACTN|nr:phospholipid/cholesterol/gamma-HCH transport system substrate-binding protein [Aeromicrobium panaciterrae]